MTTERDELAADLERAVAAAAGTPARVTDLRPLAGGASQAAWAVDIAIDAGSLAGTHALVLRRDLGGALSRMVLTREQEFAVLRAVHAGGAPAPRPYWFFARLGRAARPAFLMERLAGETIGRRIVRDTALAEARARLPAQMGEALAAIHAINPMARGLAFLPAPAPGQSAAAATLDQLEADLRAIDEPHPALELGLRWLRAHAPAPGPTVLVHGDFRVGNLVVGPAGLRGVLDWEVAHIGDPHADLGWACVRAWRFGQDQLPAGGVGDREPFFAAYEIASGRAVDRGLAFYWEALGNFQWALGALGQARRHLSGAAPSVELASLGRICAEMELELLDLIARHEQEERRRRQQRDRGPAMQDRPTATELLAAVRAFLHGEVAPALADHRLRFRTLIAANVLAIVEREITGEEERLVAVWQRLTALLAPGEAVEPPDRLDDLKQAITARRAELCRRIRAGAADAGPWRAAALAYARWEVKEKLRVANPTYLARFQATGEERAGDEAGT